MSSDQGYIVSARKYRPATFRSVVGQHTLTSTLKNAIESGRLAQAYLFCGPRGVGKTSCARIFAKTINCEHPTPEGEACGECDSCKAIDKGNSFNIVELDAASNNSVDDIRQITEQVYVPAQGGRYRVFIIDEVHMLSNAAFNAFLKTLEEPPKNVVFILATTEKHKVIPTILSRCQIYDFKRITISDIIDHLGYVAQREGIQADREALGVIARKADGAMRDALSIFDQVSASTRGNVTYTNTIESLNVLDYDYYFKMVEAFKTGDVAETLLIYKQIRDKGFDSLFMVNGLAAHIRDLMVSADPRTAPLLESSEDVARRYAEQAGSLPAPWYYAALRLLNDCDVKYRTASSKRLLVELTLIRLCQLLKPATPPFDDPDRIWPLGDPRTGIKAAAGEPEMGYGGREDSVNKDPGGVSGASEDPASGGSATREGEGKSQPRPRLSGTGRPQSFRLTDTGRDSKVTVHTVERNRGAFTPERFRAAWNLFGVRHPAMHILVNAMRATDPAPVSEEEYLVVVDHQAQRQAFESAMPQLTSFLREELGNDFVALRVEVNKDPAMNKQLPPREFLRQIGESNPVMASFIKAIEGELA